MPVSTSKPASATARVRVGTARRQLSSPPHAVALLARPSIVLVVSLEADRGNETFVPRVTIKQAPACDLYQEIPPPVRWGLNE